MAVRSKDHAKHALRDADWNSFKTQNLEEIPSLKELAKRLSKMRADVYKYHVGDGFNHFSDWIRDVFGDDKLARDIFDAPQKKAAKIIKERVKWLEKKAK